MRFCVPVINIVHFLAVVKKIVRLLVGSHTAFIMCSLIKCGEKILEGHIYNKLAPNFPPPLGLEKAGGEDRGEGEHPLGRETGMVVACM